MTEVKAGFYDILNTTDKPGVFSTKEIAIGETDTVWLSAADYAKLEKLGYTIQPNDKIESANDLLGENHKRDATEEVGISPAPVMFTRDDIAVNAGTHLSSTQGVNVNAMNAAAAGSVGMTVEEAEKINSDITGETRVIGDPAFPLTEEDNTMANEAKPGSNAGGKELERLHKERVKNAENLESQSPQLAAINAAAEEHLEEPEHNLVKDEHKANKAAEKKAPAKKSEDDKSDKTDDGKAGENTDANKTSQEAPNTVGKTPADDSSTINSQITSGNVGQTPQTTDPAARPERPARNHPANVNMP